MLKKSYSLLSKLEFYDFFWLYSWPLVCFFFTFFCQEMQGISSYFSLSKLEFYHFFGCAVNWSPCFFFSLLLFFFGGEMHVFFVFIFFKCMFFVFFILVFLLFFRILLHLWEFHFIFYHKQNNHFCLSCLILFFWGCHFAIFLLLFLTFLSLPGLAFSYFSTTK